MLVKRLLTDGTDDFDQLPVLQHCLSRLWEQAGLPMAEIDPKVAACGRHRARTL